MQERIASPNKRISEYSKTAGYSINMQKSAVFFTSTINNFKKSNKNIISNSIKKNKILWNKFHERDERFVHFNRILLKEIYLCK
jgi:hypothetical protein